MGNYRPVSNLSFMAKLVERAVASQLNDYLVANNLLQRHQSAYRKGHSTETAMLCVWSDLLTAAEWRQVILLGLLDLSAAFDCVDHMILLQRLHSVFGLTDVVLQWIESFQSDRTQQVNYLRHNRCCLEFRKDLCWVHCCMFYTRLNWLRSLLEMVFRCTSMPTTSRYTHTQRSTMALPPSTVSPRV